MSCKFCERIPKYDEFDGLLNYYDNEEPIVVSRWTTLNVGIDKNNDIYRRF